MFLKLKCLICGRENHFASNCFASYDIYGDKLPRNKRIKFSICNKSHYTIKCPLRKKSRNPYNKYAFDSDSDEFDNENDNN